MRVFRSASNQGAYNLRNALAKRARGEILTFHDADDFSLPQRIARQVQVLREPGVVACVANWVRVRTDGSFVFHWDQKATRLALASLMLTRAAFEAVGPFRSARFGADLELYTRLTSHFGARRVGRLRAPLLFGLWSPSSATRAPGAESLEDGYRSPARRRYSELIASQRGTIVVGVSEQVINATLVDMGNFVRAQDLRELT